jgi:hypothetical protein
MRAPAGEGVSRLQATVAASPSPVFVSQLFGLSSADGRDGCLLDGDSRARRRKAESNRRSLDLDAVITDDLAPAITFTADACGKFSRLTSDGIAPLVRP